jgi:hypothetical protein
MSLGMAVLSPTTLPTLDFISLIKGVDAALSPALSVILDFKLFIFQL